MAISAITNCKRFELMSVEADSAPIAPYRLYPHPSIFPWRRDMFLTIISLQAPHVANLIVPHVGSSERRVPTTDAPRLVCQSPQIWWSIDLPHRSRIIAVCRPNKQLRCGCSAIPSRWNKCLIACRADLLPLIEIPWLWLADNNT
jgi:hypothetical protein